MNKLKERIAVLMGTPGGVYRLLALKGALKLEALGLHHSRGSVYAQVKREFGLKGNKQSVADQYVAGLREAGVIQ